jgi:hypothetical protein
MIRCNISTDDLELIEESCRRVANLVSERILLVTGICVSRAALNAASTAFCGTAAIFWNREDSSLLIPSSEMVATCDVFSGRPAVPRSPEAAISDTMPSDRRIR